MAALSGSLDAVNGVPMTAADWPAGVILGPVDWAVIHGAVANVRHAVTDVAWVRRMMSIGAAVDAAGMSAVPEGYLRGFLELGEQLKLDRVLNATNFLVEGGRWLSLALAVFGGAEVDPTSPPPCMPGPYLSPVEPRGIAEAGLWYGLTTGPAWPLAVVAGSSLAATAARQAETWARIMALGASGRPLSEAGELANRLFGELQYQSCRCGGHARGCSGLRSRAALGKNCGTYCCQPAHRLASWRPEKWGPGDTLRHFVTKALTGFTSLDFFGVGLEPVDRLPMAGELPKPLQRVGNFESSMIFGAVRADRPVGRDGMTDFASEGLVIGSVLRRSCTCGKAWDPVPIIPDHAIPIDLIEGVEAEYARHTDPTFLAEGVRGGEWDDGPIAGSGRRRAGGNYQANCPDCGKPWEGRWTVVPRQLVSAPDHRLATAWSCQYDDCAAVVLGDLAVPPPDHGHGEPSRGWEPVVSYVRLGIGEELLPRGAGLLGEPGLEGRDPRFLVLLWRLRAYMKLLRYLQFSSQVIYEMVARIIWVWLQWALIGYGQGSLFDGEIYEKMLRICASDFQVLVMAQDPSGHADHYFCSYDGPMALRTCGCSQPLPAHGDVVNHYGAAEIAKDIMKGSGGLASIDSIIWLPDGKGAGLFDDILVSLRALAPMK